MCQPVAYRHEGADRSLKSFGATAADEPQLGIAEQLFQAVANDLEAHVVVPELQNHGLQLLAAQVCRRVPLESVLGATRAFISADHLGQRWAIPSEIQHEFILKEVLPRMADGLHKGKARDAQARLTATSASRHMLA